MTAVDPNRPAWVYRCYDADGRLLYIGCGLNYKARLSWHKIMSPWHADMASVTAQHYPTRAEAIVAERQAIYAEHPMHNVLYNEALIREYVEVQP